MEQFPPRSYIVTNIPNTNMYMYIIVFGMCHVGTVLCACVVKSRPTSHQSFFGLITSPVVIIII